MSVRIDFHGVPCAMVPETTVQRWERVEAAARKVFDYGVIFTKDHKVKVDEDGFACVESHLLAALRAALGEK